MLFTMFSMILKVAKGPETKLRSSHGAQMMHRNM